MKKKVLAIMLVAMSIMLISACGKTTHNQLPVPSRR